MTADDTPLLSVVIPTYGAAGELPPLLDALARARQSGLALEVVIADGGSTDGTPAVAERYGARMVRVPQGRGGQLRAGAEAARGAWLLFLHADTVPAKGWVEGVSAFMAGPENRHRAAVFRFALDEPRPEARRLEALVAWRARVLGLAYGDQGLLLSRAFYDALGGYRPFPLMEDVDLVRRIGRRALVHLDAAAVTSARRYRLGGWWLRPVRNLVCLGLYFLGVPPRLIVRLYG